MDFIQGEYVVLNTCDSPLTHMRKGTVVRTEIDDPQDPANTKKKILVGVDMGNEGYKNYLVYPEQLFHTQRAEGFDGFMEQLKLNVIPIESDEEKLDREQDDLVVKINAEKKLHNTAFNEGYEKGWQDALVHVKGMFKD